MSRNGSGKGYLYCSENAISKIDWVDQRLYNLRLIQVSERFTMAKIYLVRHGRAAASFTDDLDPGLDDLGRSQAIASCKILEDSLPLVLLSSPLKRAQETAKPLADSTGQDIQMENRLAEIPSPGLSLAKRGSWLRKVMSGKWSQQSNELIQWRAHLARCLLDIKEDTVIFSHYVAINAAVGVAEDRDEVMVFRPDNGSITIFETDGNQLTLISRGSEATTVVN